VTPNAVTLWINPSASTFGAASEPATGQLSANTGVDGFAIDRFNMRQNTATTVPANMQWDELRVGGSWASVTPPATCSAGEDFSVNEGDTVPLSGCLSPGDSATFLWTQLSGTAVALSDPTLCNPTFTAPQVSAGGETLTFKLTTTRPCSTC